MSDPGTRRAAAVGLIVAVYIAAGWFLVRPYGPVDDAYIAYRYARNFAGGAGLVFNSGERVEGYSSPLWVAILALGESLGIQPPAFSQALGVLFGVGTILLVAYTAVDWRSGLLAAALVGLDVPVLYHFFNGLETSLMTFLLTGFVALSPADHSRRTLRHAMGALLVLTRPEGLLVVLVWCAAIHVVRRQPQRHEIAVAVTATLVWLGAILMRSYYYGDWMANSARAKLLPLDMALPRGLADLLGFAWRGNALGLCVVLAIMGRHRWQRASQRRVALRWFLPAMALVLACSGGDSIPLWRFFVPIAPLLLLAAAEGTSDLAEALQRSGPSRVKFVGIAVVMCIALLAPWGNFRENMAREHFWVWSWKLIGQALGERFPRTTAVALGPVGAVSYYSQLTVVDMLGLTDRHIATVAPDRRYSYPAHQRHDGPYVLSRRPDLIMVANGPLAERLDAPFPYEAIRAYERDLIADKRFDTDYVLVHIPVGPNLFVMLYARRDFAGEHGLT